MADLRNGGPLEWGGGGTARLQRWAWERDGREKLVLRCRLLGGARRFGADGGGEGRGISWRPPAYSLFVVWSFSQYLVFED